MILIQARGPEAARNLSDTSIRQMRPTPAQHGIRVALELKERLQRFRVEDGASAEVPWISRHAFPGLLGSGTVAGDGAEGGLTNGQPS